MTLPERLHAYRDALEGDFVAGIVAMKFVAMMETEHPDELADWMRANAIKFVTSELSRQERSDRGRALHQRQATIFTATPDLFCVRWVVDDNATRRPLGQMTGADCGYVASKYEKSIEYEATLAAFMRALQKKAGAKRVEEVMSEADCERLLSSLLGPGRLPAAA